MDKNNIYVYLNIANKDYNVGTISTYEIEQSEYSTFEYSNEWLENPIAFPISKELPLSKQIFKTKNSQIFQIFYTQSFIYPVDFYFEYLLVYLKKHNLLSKIEDFNETELYNWFKNAGVHSGKFGQHNEYLKFLTVKNSMLYINDFTRTGAFRFKSDKNGEFLYNCDKFRIPSIDKIDEIIDIKTKIENNIETDEELELFHACCSSLKGRKPKMNIIDEYGNLSIAKISSLTDDNYAYLYQETFALYLANKYGINTQEYSIRKNNDGKEFLLLKRFDRTKNERHPFICLECAEDDIDYDNDKLIAETIIKICKKNATKNLREFFKRKLFRIGITNTRAFIPNTGFLYNEKTGWNLSPDYDITVGFLFYDSIDSILARENREILLTRTDYNDLMKNAYYYRITHKKAKKMIKELKKVLINYKEEALKFGFKEEDICKIRIYPKAFNKIKYSNS